MIIWRFSIIDVLRVARWRWIGDVSVVVFREVAVASQMFAMSPGKGDVGSQGIIDKGILKQSRKDKGYAHSLEFEILNNLLQHCQGAIHALKGGRGCAFM